jgi:transcriptional regulator with XRE-family HTH domain
MYQSVVILRFMSTIVSYKTIPNCLRKYRRIGGLKQKEVAAILGLKSASRISCWEKGSCLPSLVNMLRLSILYHTMPDALFSDLIGTLREEIRQKETKIFD